MLTLNKLRPLFSRTLPLLCRTQVTNALEKMPKLDEHGYELSKGVLRPEEIEDLRFNANSVYRLVAHERGTNFSEEDYYFFSGGSPVKSEFRVINLVGKTKCINGRGITALGPNIHEDLPKFREFANSCIVKRVAKDILKMNAPAIVSMSYIFESHGDWATFRKDSSFIRTSPPSTKGILVSLSDVSEGEGFFIVPNSHRVPPATYMRKVQETSTDKKKTINKVMMIPTVKEIALKSERIPLARGDILAYSGDLMYKM